MKEIPSHIKDYIIDNANKWWNTKGHKTCSICGYNTRSFKYHPYILDDIIKHIRTEHKELFIGDAIK